jgi:hypothetical protein
LTTTKKFKLKYNLWAHLSNLILNKKIKKVHNHDLDTRNGVIVELQSYRQSVNEEDEVEKI